MKNGICSASYDFDLCVDDTRSQTRLNRPAAMNAAHISSARCCLYRCRPLPACGMVVRCSLCFTETQICLSLCLSLTRTPTPTAAIRVPPFCSTRWMRIHTHRNSVLFDSVSPFILTILSLCRCVRVRLVLHSLLGENQHSQRPLSYT